MTVVIIQGSEGDFEYVLETGLPVGDAYPTTNGAVARADFAEYAAFYGLIDHDGGYPTEFHICDVAFWDRDGQHVPAEIDFRCEHLYRLLHDRFVGATAPGFPSDTLRSPLMTLPATSRLEGDALVFEEDRNAGEDAEFHAVFARPASGGELTCLFAFRSRPLAKAVAAELSQKIWRD